MKQDIKETLIFIYSDSCPVQDRERLFNKVILPVYDEAISGAFFDLDIFPESIGYEEHRDLRQEMYFITLTRLSDLENIEKVKNIRSYVFISVKNRLRNYLRDSKKKEQVRRLCLSASVSQESYHYYNEQTHTKDKIF